MSLVASLNVGVSALRSFSQGIQVISNNIANVSTVGYKSSHANYSDTFNNMLKPLVPNEKGIGAKIDPTQIGGGVQVQSVTATFSQGTVTSTGTTSDLAIAGPGYFRVKDPVTGNSYVTRAGNFRFDANGYLVTQQGYRVQGTKDATTQVFFDPSTRGYDVRSILDNPVEKTGIFSQTTDFQGNSIGLIQNIDTKDLSVGMVVYGLKASAAPSTPDTSSVAVQDLWSSVVADAASPTPTPRLSNHAIITDISGSTVKLSNGDVIGSFSSPATFKFSLPKTVKLSVSNMRAESLVDAQNGIFTVDVDDVGAVADGMVAKVTDPQTQKITYAGLSVDKTPGKSRVILNFKAFSSLVAPFTSSQALDATIPITPVNSGDLSGPYFASHFTSASNTSERFNMEFESNIGSNAYEAPRGNVGDVRITFNEGTDYVFKDINGGDLSSVEYLKTARLAVPKIKSFNVGTDGSIMANLSNGQTFTTGKVLLQDFVDPGALVREGDNLFSGMDLAGEKNSISWDSLTADNIRENTAGSAGLGLIQGSALEQSNVDIGQEFATMITTQRSFQAGSRVITVADQMLEETVNLKR